MYKKQRRIPTLFGLIILFLAISIGVYFDQPKRSDRTQATAPVIPEDIAFTNITDSSFTVSWFTKIASEGFMTINDQVSPSMTFIDDLDADNVKRPRLNHYITVKNLKENTEYSIKVISDPKCPAVLSCPSFTQKTVSQKPYIPQTIPPVRGKIIDEKDNPVPDAIVLVSITKNLPLSTRTDSFGLWVIPLTRLITDDVINRIVLSDNDLIQITAKISSDRFTKGVIDFKSIRQNLAIPPMKIGSSYNFIDLISKKDLLAGINNPDILGININNKNGKISGPYVTPFKPIDILFPAIEGDATTDYQPRLRGLGPPGKKLTVTVESTPQTARITVGSDGVWTYRPPKNLTPGIHYITIEGYDANNKLVRVKKKFIVLKSGESVLGDATASAGLSPTLSPTIVPSATSIPNTTALPVSPTIHAPSPSPTVIQPTSTIVPTLTSIPTTTPTVVPTMTEIPTPTDITLRTGSLSNTFILIGGGIGLMVLGALAVMF